MYTMKHNLPPGYTIEDLEFKSMALVGTSFVYVFGIKDKPGQLLEYSAGSRTWRGVIFGDGLWKDPYAPQPKPPCGVC